MTSDSKAVCGGGESYAIHHEFKSAPSVFWPAARGTKMFEFRKDDRGGYHVGQNVRLRCHEEGIGYTDEAPLDRTITNVLYPGQFGLQDGYCILGLAPVAAAIADQNGRLPIGDKLKDAGGYSLLPDGEDAGLGWYVDVNDRLMFLLWWKDLGNGRSEVTHWRPLLAGPASPTPEA